MDEQELAKEIARLHDMGLGYRRISQTLQAQGIHTNKDKVSQIHHRYKNCNIDIEDEELRRLQQSEIDTRERLKLEQEKEQVRKHLIILYVEQETMNFEQRKKLFTDQKKLLKFAQRTLPVIDPMLWDEFKEYCSERGYDLADATAIALGKQKDFEDQPTQDANVKGRLDLYLRNGIKECLNDWRADEQEEHRSEEESEPPINIGERTEFVTIELPDGML